MMEQKPDGGFIIYGSHVGHAAQYEVFRETGRRMPVEYLGIDASTGLPVWETT